jgi:hypothetical protein
MDSAHGQDNAQVLTGLSEKLSWRADWVVEKWFDSDDYSRGFPSDETVEIEGNRLVYPGIAVLLSLLVGAGGTAFNYANAYLGVGDSTAAEDSAQADLQAATNKLRKAMSDSSFPSIGPDSGGHTGQVVTFQSTFASGDANWAWNECGVFNSAGSTTMLNRKVITLGTKSSGATWTLKLTITITSS